MILVPRLHACAMCAKQSEAAARLVYVDLTLLATPYLVTALGLWIFARQLRRLLPMALLLALAAPALAADGPALYRDHCVVCHGAAGRGDGPAAPDNTPRPRNFATALFRLVSSREGQPAREDIFRTLTRGISGTGMPAWNHLSEEDRWALADTVLALAEAGLRADLEAEARRGGEAIDPEELNEDIADRLKASDQAQPGPVPPQGAARLARGAELFAQLCSRCHGQDGRGRRDPEWRTAEGEGLASRDLLTAPLKGGDEAETLYRRIYAGMPGSPMPSHATLKAEDIWALVAYIQSVRRAPPEPAPLAPLGLPREAINPQARAIDHDFYVTLAVTGGVGAYVLLWLLWAVARAIFRRPYDLVPAQRGNRKLMLGWVLGSTLIVLAMVNTSWSLYGELTQPLDGALRVAVTARQFCWSFAYSELGAQATGELAVPQGRPLKLEIQSRDVIHSFFVPHLRMKRDAVPGLMTVLWVQPIDRPGRYPILCNQLCGPDHSIMNATLNVLGPAAFEHWIDLHRSAP